MALSWVGPLEERLGGPLPLGFLALHAAWDAGLWVPEGEPIPPEAIPVTEPLAFGPALTPVVPFARTGAGDAWCWALAHRTPAGEPEIWLCLHDADEARVFAPTLAGWVYRCVLEHRADPDEPDDPAWAEALGALEGGEEWARMGAAPVRDVDAHIGETFGARYLERAPWQRGARQDHDAWAVQAATERMQAELHANRAADAVDRANAAFRDRRFHDVIAALAPYEAELSPAVRTKLVIARRRITGSP